MLTVYNQHHGHMLKVCSAKDVEEVRILAESYAKCGYDAFLRVFSSTEFGERFETAFSVLGGSVREHADVTFPEAHFGRDSG